MQFAILSAGEGSRLRDEGVSLPKPLIPIGGVPMIERLVSLYAQCGATKIAIIVNENSELVISKLQTLAESYPIEYMVKSTESSMHSLYELLPLLDDAPFCLSTVDTIFSPSSFRDYIAQFCMDDDCDALMALTDYIDDEKPLYASVDATGRVVGYYSKSDSCNLISAGIYCLKSSCIPILRRCVDTGLHRMRAFQSSLVEAGLKIQGYNIGKVIDVDHITDIESAELLLRKGL